MIQFQVRISGKKIDKLKAEMDILGREDANTLESQIAVQMEKLAEAFLKEIGKQEGVVVNIQRISPTPNPSPNKKHI